MERTYTYNAEHCKTLADVKRYNKLNGYTWFGRAEMKFFGTRLETSLLNKRWFITSEQPPHGQREYRVRYVKDDYGVETVGEPHKTKELARWAQQRAQAALVLTGQQPTPQDNKLGQNK